MSTTITDVEAPTGDYVDAGAPDLTTTTGAKKGHTFFGLCDMRMATFVVNGMNITMMLISIIVAAARGPMFWKSLGEAMVLALPGLVLSGLGLYGALKYELWAVILASAGFVVSFVVDAILMQWLVLPILAIVIYPHVVLGYEIKTGIMTEENYATSEEFVIPEGKMMIEKAHSYLARKPTADATI
jgi:hypothetical protein